MDAAILIGRVLLVAIFIISGLGKFADLSGTAAHIAAKGLPAPLLLAFAAAAAEVVGGLMIAAGWKTRYAAVALALYTGVAAFFFHAFWTMAPGPEQKDAMIHAMKNLSIIGGFIVLAIAGAGRLSLDMRAEQDNWHRHLSPRRP